MFRIGLAGAGFLFSRSSTESWLAMDALEEFRKSLSNGKASTRRVYLAGAAAAISAMGSKASESHTYGELAYIVRDLVATGRIPRTCRVSPFIRFLEGNTGKTPAKKHELRRVRSWVVQTLGEGFAGQRDPSIAARRDMALIAAMCAAPNRGNPRNWPKTSLTVSAKDVALWNERVEEPSFALALRFWHAWRERLSRPDQLRLYRKPQIWGESTLLFPGPKGGPLARAALHNALRRLLGVGEGSRDITPEQIRAAFFDCGSPR